MSIDYGPFDAGIGADRTEDFWRSFFKHFVHSGVIDGERNEFVVSERGAGANMSVDVATGTGFVRGHWVDSDAVTNKAISNGDASNPRIDRIVLRADFTSNTISIEVLEGTPAASPTAPALTQSTSRWELSLAQVAVAAAESTSIVTADITDERTIQGFPQFDYETAPTDGATFTYDSATGLWAAGSAASASGVEVVAQSTTTTTVVNTTAETALISQAITGGTLAAGQMLRLTAIGKWQNAGAGNVTYKMRLKFGATTVLETGTVTVSASATDLGAWHLNAELFVESATAQRIGAFLWGGRRTTSWKQNDPAFYGPGYGAAAEDTSTDKALALTIEMGLNVDANVNWEVQSWKLEKVAAA